MKKNILTIAAFVICQITLAQTQQTISVQPEKTVKGTPATTTSSANKEGNPNTPVEATLINVSMTIAPSATLDPSIIPAVGKAVESKKTESKKSPK